MERKGTPELEPDFKKEVIVIEAPRMASFPDFLMQAWSAFEKSGYETSVKFALKQNTDADDGLEWATFGSIENFLTHVSTLLVSEYERALQLAGSFKGGDDITIPAQSKRISDYISLHTSILRAWTDDMRRKAEADEGAVK